MASSLSWASRRCAHWAVCGALSACSVAPSRAPLGGNYDPLPTHQAGDRREPVKALVAASSPPSSGDPKSTPAAPPSPATPVVVTDKAVSSADTLRYQPLNVGDRIEGDVTLTFKAELPGSPPDLPAGGSVNVDCKLHVELKIVKASAHALEQLELSVTTLSIHTDLGGRRMDSKPEPPELYDVTLGPSPKIRARGGSPLDPEERAIVLVLVGPLVDFHARWAAAPTLALEAGWSSRVPVTLPTFADGHNETAKAGPLSVRYAGRDARDVASGSVPFDLTLPLKYSAELGKLDLELAGKARLSASNGRPTSIDLSGPFSAEGGHDAPPLSFSGSMKFTAQLSYH